MSASFLYREGFFISWPTKHAGNCRIFVKSKSEADTLYATLKSKNPNVEKYAVSFGNMKKLA